MLKKIREQLEHILNSNLIEQDKKTAENILKKYIRNATLLRACINSGEGILFTLQIEFLKMHNRDFLFEKFYEMYHLFSNDKDIANYTNGIIERITNIQNIQWSEKRSSENFVAAKDDFEAVKILFCTIDNAVEKLLKPYLSILAYCFSKKSKKEYRTGTIGDDVNILLTQFPELKVRDISLSQWRNIAAHGDYLIKNGKITCTYGYTSKKQIIITKEDLLSITNEITMIYNAIYTAFSFFCINSKKIVFHNVYMRDELWLDNLRIKLALDNYLYLDFVEFENFCILVVKDILKEGVLDIQKDIQRIMYLLEFTFLIFNFKNKSIRYGYCNNEDITLCAVDIKKDVISKILKQKLSVKYLFENFEFKYLKNEIYSHKKV